MYVLFSPLSARAATHRLMFRVVICCVCTYFFVCLLFFFAISNKTNENNKLVPRLYFPYVFVQVNAITLYVPGVATTSFNDVSPVLCLEAVSALSSESNFGYQICQASSPELGWCCWILQPLHTGNLMSKVERTQCPADFSTPMNSSVSSLWTKQPGNQCA